METNELRVGNYYDHNGEILTITPNVICEVWDAKRTWCKPIPLTEEWLLKFGFWEESSQPTTEHGKYYSIGYTDCKYSFAYAKFRDDWGFYHSYTDAISEENNNKFDFISCGIKYVHQLQNLYFALAGEELVLTNNINQK